MAVSAPHANGRQLLLQADRQFAIFSPVLLVFVVRSLVRYAASKESIPHNKRKNIYIYPLANMLTLGSWAVFFLFISVFCLYIFAELHTQVHAAHIYTLHMCKRGPYQLSLRQRAVSHVVQCSRLKLLENYKKKKNILSRTKTRQRWYRTHTHITLSSTWSTSIYTIYTCIHTARVSVAYRFGYYIIFVAHCTTATDGEQSSNLSSSKLHIVGQI